MPKCNFNKLKLKVKFCKLQQNIFTSWASRCRNFLRNLSLAESFFLCFVMIYVLL